MKKTLLTVFALCGITTAINAQVFQWANQIESTGNSQGLSISSNGTDIYSTGTFVDTADFNPGTGTHNLISNGGLDAYVQKLDQNGNFLWAKKIGGSGQDIGRKINDYGTHIIISGTFSDTVDFNPGTAVERRISNGYADIFILALDGNGNFLWVKTFGGSSNEIFGGQELDNANDIVISGGFSDTMTVNVGSTSTSVYSDGFTDVFVLKMDLATATIDWIKTMPGSGRNSGSDLVIKSNKKILLTGRFTNSMDANPDLSTSSVFNLSSQASGGYNVYLIELDQNGGFVNAFSYKCNNDMESYDIELDGNENIYLTGYFKSTADFELKSLVSSLSSNSGSQDCFITKLNSSKDLIWAKAFGSTGLDQSFKIKVGASGDVYTTGRFSGTLDFDPGTGTEITSSVGGSNDIYIHKLNSAGDFQLVHVFGSSSAEYGRGMELDNSGNLYVNGSFGQTIDFDPTSGTTNLTAPIGVTNTFMINFYDANSVGTKELEKNNSISLYPNPVQTQLFFELENEEITEIKILDISGKRVKSILNFNTKSVDVSGLHKGVYILSIYTKKGVSTSRFVKQ